MLRAVIRYIYRFGLFAFVARCFDRGYRPKGMGGIYFLRNGVHRVGTLWAVPTLKSVRVWRLLRKAEKIDVVLTLRWGGGASAYVEEKIRQKATGEWTVVVKPTGDMGRLSLTLWNGNVSQIVFEVNSLRALWRLGSRCRCIVVNNLIEWHSFFTADAFTIDDYENVIRDVLCLKHKLRVKCCYLVHDYFSVCPRYTLTMDSPVYCASEYSCVKCKACLSNNDRAGLLFQPGLDIRRWRLIWHRLLDACEEVRTFSNDTLARMRQIYPAVKWTLVPHQPVVRFQRKLRLQKERLVVGVFGIISEDKGSGVVIELVNHIRRGGAKVDVVVIGELILPKGAVVPADLVVTGKYSPDQLVGLIEEHRINMALFPSICPETFSYMIQELMTLDLPVVCFDIGAPKDRVREYDKGHVCHKINAEDVLRAIHLLASKMGIQIYA